MAGRFEVHEHSFIRGPRANAAGERSRLVHSHFGGDQPHTHPDTGPGVYTIDKDDWFRATGLKGGGRKKFTDVPSGEQLPVIPRKPEENEFEIVVGDPPKGFEGTGGGWETAARMVLGFGMRARVRDGRRGGEPPEAA